MCEWAHLALLVRDGCVAHCDQVRPVVEGDAVVQVCTEELDGLPGDHPGREGGGGQPIPLCLSSLNPGHLHP